MKINSEFKTLCVICNINKVEPEFGRNGKITNPPICKECLTKDNYKDLERKIKDLENEE